MPSLQETLITKASGELVPFSEEKLKNSLRNAGADESMIDTIISEIEPHLYKGISTKKIYKYAFNILRDRSRFLAALVVARKSRRRFTVHQPPRPIEISSTASDPRKSHRGQPLTANPSFTRRLLPNAKAAPAKPSRMLIAVVSWPIVMPCHRTKLPFRSSGAVVAKRCPSNSYSTDRPSTASSPGPVGLSPAAHRHRMSSRSVTIASFPRAA